MTVAVAVCAEQCLSENDCEFEKVRLPHHADAGTAAAGVVGADGCVLGRPGGATGRGELPCCAVPHRAAPNIMHGRETGRERAAVNT